MILGFLEENIDSELLWHYVQQLAGNASVGKVDPKTDTPSPKNTGGRSARTRRV